MRTMNKMVGMLRHRCLFSTYVGWKNYTKSMKAERANHLKSTKLFIHNMMHNSLQLRFNQWREYYAQRKKLKKFVGRFMGGKMHRMMDYAFRMLRKNMVDEEIEEGRLENASREEVRFIEIAPTRTELTPRQTFSSNLRSKASMLSSNLCRPRWATSSRKSAPAACAIWSATSPCGRTSPSYRPSAPGG